MNNFVRFSWPNQWGLSWKHHFTVWGKKSSKRSCTYTLCMEKLKAFLHLCKNQWKYGTVFFWNGCAWTHPKCFKSINQDYFRIALSYEKKKFQSKFSVKACLTQTPKIYVSTCCSNQGFTSWGDGEKSPPQKPKICSFSSPPGKIPTVDSPTKSQFPFPH